MCKIDELLRIFTLRQYEALIAHYPSNVALPPKKVEHHWFRVKSGVGRGGVVSLVLFILYTVNIIKEVEGEKKVRSLVFAYADDIVIVTDSWINQ